MQRVIIVIEKTREGLRLNLEENGTGSVPDELAIAGAMKKVVRNVFQHFHDRFDEGTPASRLVLP